VSTRVDVSDEIASACGLLRHHHLRVIHEKVHLQERYRQLHHDSLVRAQPSSHPRYASVLRLPRWCAMFLKLTP